MEGERACLPSSDQPKTRKKFVNAYLNLAALLRALGVRHERATAEQLARDPQIVSPHKVNYDAHSLMEYTRTGRPSLGPTLADINSIANDLRTMALQRYIQQIAPGIYRAV